MSTRTPTPTKKTKPAPSKKNGSSSTTHSKAIQNVKRDLNKLAASTSKAAKVELIQPVQNGLEVVKTQTTAKITEGRQTVVGLVTKAEDFVRNDPRKSVLISAAIGAIGMFFLSNRK